MGRRTILVILAASSAALLGARFFTATSSSRDVDGSVEPPTVARTASLPNREEVLASRAAEARPEDASLDRREVPADAEPWEAASYFDPPPFPRGVSPLTVDDVRPVLEWGLRTEGINSEAEYRRFCRSELVGRGLRDLPTEWMNAQPPEVRRSLRSALSQAREELLALHPEYVAATLELRDRVVSDGLYTITPPGEPSRLGATRLRSTGTSIGGFTAEFRWEPGLSPRYDEVVARIDEHLEHQRVTLELIAGGRLP